MKLKQFNYKIINSTNDLAIKIIRSTNNKSGIVIAENQKKGRGQFGKNWSSFKGNLVYVDVWATWCGPCIAELPALEKLQENYEGKKIIFLSISVDTDKDAWVKMLSDEELGGVQLWADGWSQITQSYAIFGIPRFLLIDKDGRLISVDAPRPSSSEIRTLIEKAYLFL